MALLLKHSPKFQGNTSNNWKYCQRLDAPASPLSHRGVFARLGCWRHLRLQRIQIFTVQLKRVTGQNGRACTWHFRGCWKGNASTCRAAPVRWRGSHSRPRRGGRAQSAAVSPLHRVHAVHLFSSTLGSAVRIPALLYVKPCCEELIEWLNWGVKKLFGHHKYAECQKHPQN